MSRSAVYGTLHLTAEQRASNEARRRATRLRTELQPRLQLQLQQAVQLLRRGGALPTQQSAELLRRVGVARTTAELRSVAVDLGHVDLSDRLRRPGVSLPATQGTAPTAAPDRGGLVFDLQELTATIQSLDRTIADLPIDREIARPAAEAIAAAMRRSEAEDWVGTASAIERARHAVDEADREVSAQLDRAEAQLSTIDAVQDILHDLGFTTNVETGPSGEAHITGTTRDGQTSQVQVTSDGDAAVGVRSGFTDPRTEVDGDHAAADDPCEPAVLNQVAFRSRLAEQTGLLASKVEALDDGRRGPDTGRAQQRLHHTITPPKHRSTP